MSNDPKRETWPTIADASVRIDMLAEQDKFEPQCHPKVPYLIARTGGPDEGPDDVWLFDGTPAVDIIIEQWDPTLLTFKNGSTVRTSLVGGVATQGKWDLLKSVCRDNGWRRVTVLRTASLETVTRTLVRFLQLEAFGTDNPMVECSECKRQMRMQEYETHTCVP